MSNLITRSNYLIETENLVRKFEKISLADFWRAYVIPYKNAPHYRIPYKGFCMCKLPCDMFIYPDIIRRAKVERVIEIGTEGGGSALFLSDLLASLGGMVVTVDINSPDKKILDSFGERHITFIKGDINDSETINNIMKHCSGKKCLVIDDGSHNTNDVHKAFCTLNQLVPPGGFYIIEDGITSSLLEKVLPERGDFQPNKAIALILQNHPDFEIFRDYDEFIFSAVLMGILQRKNDGTFKA